MADIQSATWLETAAGNNAAPPDGWPEGMAYSSVNDAAREVMGPVKREWNRSHPTLISAGSANAFTLTYTTPPPSLPGLTPYVQGFQFAFRAHADCAAGATLNVNSLGAKLMGRMGANGFLPLWTNDFRNGQLVYVSYDNGADRFILISPDPKGAMRHLTTYQILAVPQVDIALPPGIQNFRMTFTDVGGTVNGDTILVLFSQNNGAIYWSNPANYVRSALRSPAAGLTGAEAISGDPVQGNVLFEDFSGANRIFGTADIFVGSAFSPARWHCRASATRWNNGAPAFSIQEHAGITNVSQSAPLTNVRLTPQLAPALAAGGAVSLFAVNEG